MLNTPGRGSLILLVTLCLLLFGATQAFATPETTAHGIAAGWMSSDVEVSLVASDTEQGVSATYYALNKGQPNLYTIPFMIAVEGTTRVDYWSVDCSGNVEAARTAEVLIDRTPPSTTFHGYPSYAASVHTSPGLTSVLATARLFTDYDPSGLVNWYWRVDGGEWNTGDLVGIPTDRIGPRLIEWYAVDTAGNHEPVQATLVNMYPERFEDFSDHVVRAPAWRVVSGPFTSGRMSCANAASSTASFTFEGTGFTLVGKRDQYGGIAEVCIDDGARYEVDFYANEATDTSPYAVQQDVFMRLDLENRSHSVTVTVTGRRNPGALGSWVYFDAVDLNGTLSMDREPPYTRALCASGWSSSNREVSLLATDAATHVVRTLCTVDGAEFADYSGPIDVSREGTTVVSFQSIDVVGNREPTRTVTVMIDSVSPSAPSILSYNLLTETSVGLSWPAGEDEMSGVSHYEVRDGESLLGMVDRRTCLAEGLVPGSLHEFSVTTVDAAGNRSLPRRLVLAVPVRSHSAGVSTGESVVTTLVVEVPGFGNSVEMRPAVVAISDVTTPGVWTVARSEQPPAGAPSTFKFVDDYYDVSFTGGFEGTVTVALPYDARIPDARALNLKVQHWVGNRWESVPTTVALANHTLTAELTSLSPLVVVEPTSAVTSATITPVAFAPYPDYDKPGVFTLRLSAAEGTDIVSLEGFLLTLQRSSGTTWTTCATATPVIGVPGSYIVTGTCVGGIRNVFRAHLEDNVLYSANEVTLTAVPHARLTTPSRSTAYPRRYSTSYVSGTIYPRRHYHAKLQVWRYSSTRRKYYLYTTRSITTSTSGYYKAGVRLSSRGTYKFRVYVGDDLPTALVARTYSSYSGKVYLR